MRYAVTTAVRKWTEVRENDETHIFPLILIACNLGAAVTYAASRDVRKVIYWIAAEALNAVVTF